MNNELLGASLYSLLLEGYENLYARQAYVDALNVFPVPDGDTGKNMVASMTKGIAEAKDIDNVSALAQRFAKSCLFSARGNSGVILSQFFSGVSNCLQALGAPASVDTATLALAFYKGYEQALASVSNPVEGTILTVLKDSTSFALEQAQPSTSLAEYFSLLVESAKRSLENTPNLLPVLKESEVVDAGGAGIVCIFEGMQAAAEGRKLLHTHTHTEAQMPTTTADKLPSASYQMRYGYCTEFILQLLESGEAFDKDAFVAHLQTLGDSIVAAQNGDIVKIHVHTFSPEKALAYAHSFGEFLTLKIENMDLQNLAESAPTLSQAAKKKHLKNAIVAVASGEGISQYFLEIGAHSIIHAGQTQNPSAEDFIEAFRQLDADNIIVLPNNKNIVLAAKQAQALYQDAAVFVVETASIAEGYSALSMMDTTATDTKEVLQSMTANLSRVTTGLVAAANRNATIHDVEIREGDFVSIVNGEINACAEDKNSAALKLLENLEDIDEKETIILFVGADVSNEEKEELEEALNEKYPLYDIFFIEGNQAVYSYILSIE